MRLERVICTGDAVHRNGSEEEGIGIQHRLHREDEFVQRDARAVGIGDSLVHEDVMVVVVNGGVDEIVGTRGG